MDWLKLLIETALKGKLVEGTKQEDIISAIVEGAKKDIGKTYVPKEEFNSKNEELKSTKTKMDEMQKKVEDLSKSGDEVVKLKTDLEKVNTDFTSFKTDAEKRETNRQKVVAIEKSLRDAKASDDAIDLLTSQFDVEKIILDSKGNIVDWDNHLKPVKESRKTLFGEVKSSGTPPANPKGEPAKATKQQLIDQYNAAEKRKDMQAMFNLQTQIKQIKEE